ncbi:hypothetical protein, partial [Cognatilysobacter lacus]|uniref:hypothetical protein n=1 Tax=Cognatilysobacter lacus TaxID=1643323 RepID=UPI001960EC79
AQVAPLIAASAPRVAPLLPVVVTAAVYVFLLGLLGLAAVGRDWARFLGAVIALLALLENAPHVLSFGSFALAWFAAKACGLALLYAPPSNRWFRQVGPNNSSKPTPLRGAA